MPNISHQRMTSIKALSLKDANLNIKESMKLQFPVLTLFASWLIFTGCPYESQVPIDLPSVNINPDLLGTWEDNANKKETYQITHQDEYTYHVVVTDTENDEHEVYHAYASVVKGVTFLNIAKVKASEPPSKYLLYKLDITDDRTLTLSEITDNIDETFTTSRELKKFIGCNMKNSYFFGNATTSLIRRGK
jgi:hypothetical protein